jgi:hypothetical protein
MNYDSYTFTIFGWRVYYDCEGTMTGFGFSAGGQGFGISGEQGTSDSINIPLQN